MVRRAAGSGWYFQFNSSRIEKMPIASTSTTARPYRAAVRFHRRRTFTNCVSTPE